MPTEIIHYPNDESSTYISFQAAYIACVSLDFLLVCEREGLITPRYRAKGLTGYTMKDIQRLQIIRRLHEDLNLNFPAIDVVLHLREQIEELAGQRSSFERRLLEQQAELQQLKELLQRLQPAG
ncbi:MAG: MerR family transcriptional regulator [Anaerolineales bacterium]|nr:MerR family transcriptional regulator [Anaerolineales bacterium]